MPAASAATLEGNEDEIRALGRIITEQMSNETNEHGEEHAADRKRE